MKSRELIAAQLRTLAQGLTKSFRQNWKAVLEPPAYGLIGGTLGGFIGGLITCYPFSLACAILGAPAGFICGILAIFYTSNRLRRAAILGLICGWLVGFSFGVFCWNYAPL
jgi:hypothetical protein